MIKVNNSNKNVAFGDPRVYMKCDILAAIARGSLAYLTMPFLSIGMSVHICQTKTYLFG